MLFVQPVINVITAFAKISSFSRKQACRLMRYTPKSGSKSEFVIFMNKI